MTDTETQLRLILLSHSADSVHLLDEVLNEALGLNAECLKQAEENRVSMEARAYGAERNLSALREAVGPHVARWKAAGEKLQNGYLEKEECEAVIAAHDAAPAAPLCTCWQQQDLEDDTPCQSCRELIARQSAPTLTLEELEEALSEAIDTEMSVAAHAVGRKTLAALEKVLAQKGAGRG